MEGYVMKEKTSEWFGRLPASWSIIPLKYAFSIKKNIAGETGHTVLSVTQKGIKPKKMNEKGQFALDYSKYQLVNPGDFVMNHMDLLTGWVDISQYDGVTSPDYRVFFNTNPNLFSSEYYRYIFQLCYTNRIFYGMGQGVAGFGRWRLPSDMFLNFSLPVPGIDEQRAISSYLDKQCALIDDAITEAKISIEEYNSWKASIILEAVTKGLDKDAKLKESSIDGLGQIHALARIIRLKHLINTIESGVSVNAGQDAARGDEIGVLKTSCVSKNKFIAEENKNVNREEYSRVACPVRGQSLIVSRMNTPELVGACGYVDRAYPNLFLPDRLWQITCLPTCNTKYIWYFLSCRYTRNYYASLATGTSSSMQNISQAQFGNLQIVLPNIDEQARITKYLDSICEQIDTITENKQTLIENLESYKRSLIFEVVTGKRKVVQ